MICASLLSWMPTLGVPRTHATCWALVVPWIWTFFHTRILRHFLDRGTMGFFPGTARVAQLAVPAVDQAPWKVLWHLDAVLGEGLFPCTRPLSEVYCPSHFFPRQWVWQLLSILEFPRLYQLPLGMDPLLRQHSPTHGLPFEDYPPPNLFISIFQQLWEDSNGRGYSSKSVSEETPPTWSRLRL
jgi:hypothetical protein